MALPVHALAEADFAQQPDATGLQHAGADALEHIGAALALQHDAVDAAPVQNMRQQQTGRAAADDRDLSARSRGHNKAYQNPNCGYWQANLAGKPRRRRQACVGGLMPRYEGERRASQRLPAAARKRSYNRG